MHISLPIQMRWFFFHWRKQYFVQKQHFDIKNILMLDLFLTNMQVFTLQDIDLWTGVDYYDVFISCLDSHSDGTHSLQRIRWWASDVMLHFSKSDVKQTHLHLGCPEGEHIFSNFPFLGELFLKNWIISTKRRRSTQLLSWEHHYLYMREPDKGSIALRCSLATCLSYFCYLSNVLLFRDLRVDKTIKPYIDSP